DGDVPKAVRAEWEERRGELVLGIDPEREGWKPQPRETRPFKGGGYALSFATEVWMQRRDLEGFVPGAELVLEGHAPKRGKGGSGAGKMGLLEVVAVPGAAADDKAAAEAARKHFLKHQATSLELEEKKLKLDVTEDRQGNKQEKPGAKVGGLQGQVSKNRL